MRPLVIVRSINKSIHGKPKERNRPHAAPRIRSNLGGSSKGIELQPGHNLTQCEEWTNNRVQIDGMANTKIETIAQSIAPNPHGDGRTLWCKLSHDTREGLTFLNSAKRDSRKETMTIDFRFEMISCWQIRRRDNIDSIRSSSNRRFQL